MRSTSHRDQDGFIHDFKEVLKKVTTIIGHNIIDFDLLVLKLYGVIEDYIIAEDWRECLLKIDGESYEMAIFDTLVASKTMNPDRYGGHSLDEWGKRVGVHKIDWRGEAIKLGADRSLRTEGCGVPDVPSEDAGVQRARR
jgi:hypothetical protein